MQMHILVVIAYSKRKGIFLYMFEINIYFNNLYQIGVLPLFWTSLASCYSQLS
jgi:hypothetical protein